MDTKPKFWFVTFPPEFTTTPVICPDDGVLGESDDKSGSLRSGLMVYVPVGIFWKLYDPSELV
jgi:hypothetical protein